jgi:hypothetical protein
MTFLLDGSDRPLRVQAREFMLADRDPLGEKRNKLNNYFPLCLRHTALGCFQSVRTVVPCTGRASAHQPRQPSGGKQIINNPCLPPLSSPKNHPPCLEILPHSLGDQVGQNKKGRRSRVLFKTRDAVFMWNHGNLACLNKYPTFLRWRKVIRTESIQYTDALLIAC